MSLRDDERAQAIQIGAVLLFAILIILLALYQAFVVPNQNREVEAEHLQTITEQMQDLRNGLVSIPSIGEGRSVTLELGTTYPPRFFALSPSPPAGTIRTAGTETGLVNVTVANAVSIDDEVADFWDGTNRSYDTGDLVYQPGYHEFRNAPRIVYDNSLLVHRFDEGNLTRAAQRIVDGRQLSLGTVNGSMNRAASDAVAIDMAALSASSRRIPVTNETGESVVLEIASQFDADRWESELLDAGEFTNQTGHVVAVTDEPIPGTTFRLIRIELEQDVTYDLRLSRIGVGTGAVGTDAVYLTAVGGTNVEQNETFTAEVRDRFNNPLSNVTVDPGDDCSLDPQTTDVEGQVHYECPNRGTVTLEIDDGNQAYEQVTFGMPVVDEQDPVIDTSATSATIRETTFNTGGRGGSGQYNLAQVSVNYSVTDQPSGLDHVAFSVRNGSGLVMNATHRVQGDASRVGTWVSPWYEESDVGSVEVRIDVYDRAGNSNSTILP